MKKGVLFAFSAYFVWGLSPIYWKLIQNIPSIEIIGHRIFWSFLFVLGVVVIKKDWNGLSEAIKNRKISLTMMFTAGLLALNWLVYIWAVNSNYIVDASLGYFINPLVNVVLGVLFLREKLRLWQWIPVGLAGLGVLYLTISYGTLPWIGLILAFSFGIYGLLKKKSTLSSLHSFTLETGFLFLPATVYLGFLSFTNQGALGHSNGIETGLLVFTGVMTGLPLLLFGAAAKEINLSTLGFIQYIAPTLQFLIGVLIFGESFSQDQMIGFGMIWAALLIYSTDSVMGNRDHKVAVPGD